MAGTASKEEDKGDSSTQSVQSKTQEEEGPEIREEPRAEEDDISGAFGVQNIQSPPASPRAEEGNVSRVQCWNIQCPQLPFGHGAKSLAAGHSREYAKRVWERYFLPLLAVYSVWLAPVELGFFPSTWNYSWTIVGYIMDGFFGLDIILTFVHLVNQSFWSQVLTWFWVTLDAIAILMALVHFITTVKKDIPSHVAFACNIARLLRMVRMRFINDTFARLEKNVKVYYSWIRCAKLVFVTILAVHYEGCLFYVSASQNPEARNTWIGASLHDESLPMRYLNSVYWSMATVTSTGYGDLHPVSSYEKIFTVLAMLFNFGLVCYVVGNITELIMSMSNRTRYYRSARQSIVDYIDRNDLPLDLQETILEYIEEDFKTDNMYQSNIVNHLPKPIRSRINQHLILPILQMTSLFEGTSSKFLHQLSMAMKAEYYPPHEYIVEHGVLFSSVYIVFSGCVELITIHNGIEKVLAEGKEGYIIGEWTLLSTLPERYALRTQRLTKLLEIDHRTFATILHANRVHGERVIGNFHQSFMVKKAKDKRFSNMSLQFEDLHRLDSLRVL